MLRALYRLQIRSQLNEKWPRIVEHAARVAKSLPATQVGVLEWLRKAAMWAI